MDMQVQDAVGHLDTDGLQQQQVQQVQEVQQEQQEQQQKHGDLEKDLEKDLEQQKQPKQEEQKQKKQDLEQQEKQKLKQDLEQTQLQQQNHDLEQCEQHQQQEQQQQDLGLLEGHKLTFKGASSLLQAASADVHKEQMNGSEAVRDTAGAGEPQREEETASAIDAPGPSDPGQCPDNAPNMEAGTCHDADLQHGCTKDGVHAPKPAERTAGDSSACEGQKEEKSVIPEPSSADHDTPHHRQTAHALPGSNAAVKFQVAEFVKAVLEPMYRARLISKAVHKSVVRSAVEKIVERHLSQAPNHGTGSHVSADFLIEEAESIRKFISKLVVYEKSLEDHRRAAETQIAPIGASGEKQQEGAVKKAG